LDEIVGSLGFFLLLLVINWILSCSQDETHGIRELCTTELRTFEKRYSVEYILQVSLEIVSFEIIITPRSDYQVENVLDW